MPHVFLPLPFLSRMSALVSVRSRVEYCENLLFPNATFKDPLNLVQKHKQNKTYHDVIMHYFRFVNMFWFGAMIRGVFLPGSVMSGLFFKKEVCAVNHGIGDKFFIKKLQKNIYA